MSNNDVLRRAIRLALFANVAVTTGITAANAADAGGPNAPAPDEASGLTEVIVTGTRLQQPGLEAISPVTVINAEQIKEQGVTRIEDLLNTLPQVFGDQGGNVSNGATGEATVNLRNLGTQRTLVLINGRRLMPGDPTIQAASAPDINNIPVALVERVDVLTGGASSTYGADAVAGVVNFIMNDHFEGIRIDANASEYNHHQHNTYLQDLNLAHGFTPPTGTVNDGKTKDITFLIGSNLADGKGNITAYAGYRKIDPLLESQRDFSNCSTDPNPGAGGFTCGGSSTAATGRFIPNFSYLPGGPEVPTGGNYTVGPGGAFVPFTNAARYNYAATNFFQRADERWTGGEFAHYDVNDKVQVYNEFMFMHDASIGQEAPGGAFFGSGTAVDPITGIPNGGVVTNCNNPLLSASEVTALCGAAGAAGGLANFTLGRRNVEGGTRDSDLEHTSFRVVVGTRGDIMDGLKFDTYLMEGQTLYQNNSSGDFSKSALTNALQVVTGPGGTPVCASGAIGCVPYNIFTPGGVTPAALAYVSIPTLTTGTTEERVWEGHLTADMGKWGIKSPFATDGLSVDVGSEWRSEHVILHTDVPQIDNDVSGAGNPVLPLQAGFTVWEGFIEAGAPILQDMPFAKSLTALAGYRYSAYNLGFDTNTFKGGLEWAPTSDIKLRASYQHAVRAPNLQELFQQKIIALDGSTDPCASTSSTPATATLAQCARTGVTAAQYGHIIGNSAAQYNGLIGGNPALKPETAETGSLGFVITPSFVPNLAITVDYFNIHVKNIIGSYGYDYQLNQCITNGTFCQNVHRDAAGSLWLSEVGYINDPTLNLGALQTRGGDFTMNYALDMAAAGKLTFVMNGTYTAQLNTTPVVGGGTYDCAGYFGNTCGIPTPKWKHTFRVNYETPFTGLSVGAQWRYIHAVLSDTESGNPLLNDSSGANAAAPQFHRIPTYNYLDLTAAYDINKTIGFRVGVNNVFDKDPPQLTSDDFGSAFVNGNTYAQVYDALGRYLFANVTLNF